MSSIKSVSKWAFLLILAIVLFCRHLSRFDFESGAIPQDFSVYVKAVRLIREGLSPYEPTVFLTYKYSPGALALFYFLPSNPISAWLTAKFFYVLSWFIALGAAIPTRNRREWIALIAGIVLTWKGILEGLDFGQFEFACLFVAFMGALAFGRRPVLAGFLAGTLAWLKLPWGLLIFPFLILSFRQGRERFLKVAAGIAAATVFWAIVVPFALFGPTRTWQFTQDWIVTLRTQPTHLFFIENANQSLFATVSRAFDVSHGTAAFLIAAALAGALFLALIYRTFRTPLNKLPVTWVTPWLILLLLVNPLSWRWASMLAVGFPTSDLERSSERGVNPRSVFRFVCWAAIIALLLLQQNPIVKLFGIQHWTKLHDYGLITWQWIAMLLLLLR